MLSRVGKDILIKACAQAIPMFAMTCFDITKGLCDQINNTISRLFGANQDKENNIHWISWEKLTLPKEKCGLGYKDLYAFNLAMLAKTDSLCARVMKALYFPDCSIFYAQPKNGISYALRSILKWVNLLRQGVIKFVDDGATIDIWNDPWLRRSWSRQPTVHG
jgi:hypothetical protein